MNKFTSYNRSNMKIFKSIILIALAIFAFSMNSCKDSDDVDPLPNKNDTTLTFQFTPVFKSEVLNRFNETVYINAANDTLGFSKMKLLISNFVFQKMDDSYDTLKDMYAYLDFESGRNSFNIEGLPMDEYKSFSFFIGLDSAINHGDPTQWGADHPLNPLVNGLHWNWAGGYQFNSIEGDYFNEGVIKKFSYHIATKKYMRWYNFNTSLNYTAKRTVKFELKAHNYFESPAVFSIKNDGDLTHSSANDPLMDKLIENTWNLFDITEIE
jgi:hypothetical protein